MTTTIASTVTVAYAALRNATSERTVTLTYRQGRKPVGATFTVTYRPENYGRVNVPGVKPWLDMSFEPIDGVNRMPAEATFRRIFNGITALLMSHAIDHAENTPTPSVSPAMAPREHAAIRAAIGPIGCGIGFGIGGAWIVSGALIAVSLTPAAPEHASVAPGPYAEEHALFDCRIDGNRVCGPTAEVPVPDTGGVLDYVPWSDAPAPTWRPDFMAGAGIGVGVLNPRIALSHRMKPATGTAGVPETDKWAHVSMSPTLGYAIGAEYLGLPDYDASDAVRQAYARFAYEVRAQFRALPASVWVCPTDPYRDAPEMFADVRENNRLCVLSSAATGGHPYLTDRENNMFRAVHDYHGHFMSGRGFDRHGEEAAFQRHSLMFSPAARRALTMETRGQSSAFIWHNGGAEFPTQKLGLLPEWCTRARNDFVPLVGAGVGVGVVNPRVSRKPGDVLPRNFGVTTRSTVARILSWFDSASDDELLAGLAWYGAAREHAECMADTYGVTVEQAAAVIAHLSPQLGWEENLAAAYELLETGNAHAVLGSSIERAKVAMLATAPVETFGPDAHKTRAFYANILGDTDAVTVDRWAVRVAVGAYDADTQKRFARVGSYDAIAHAYRIAARRRDIEPSDMQAITWVVARATLG